MRKLAILVGIIAIAASTPANANGLWDWLLSWSHQHTTTHCDSHDTTHCDH